MTTTLDGRTALKVIAAALAALAALVAILSGPAFARELRSGDPHQRSTPSFDHGPRSERYREAVTLADKLHPDRFTEMSGRMAAVVGYVLGESWSEPEIGWLSVTPDGHVVSDTAMVGVAADLDRNLLNLLLSADLTADERAEFERRYRERVDDWRPVLAGPMPATDRLTRPDFGAPPIQA